MFSVFLYWWFTLKFTFKSSTSLTQQNLSATTVLQSWPTDLLPCFWIPATAALWPVASFNPAEIFPIKRFCLHKLETNLCWICSSLYCSASAVLKLPCYICNIKCWVFIKDSFSFSFWPYFGRSCILLKRQFLLMCNWVVFLLWHNCKKKY